MVTHLTKSLHDEISACRDLCICGDHPAGEHPVPLLSTGLSNCTEVVSAVEGVSRDGRRQWTVILADGTKELVVELRPV